MLEMGCCVGYMDPSRHSKLDTRYRIDAMLSTIAESAPCLLTTNAYRARAQAFRTSICTDVSPLGVLAWVLCHSVYEYVRPGNADSSLMLFCHESTSEVELMRKLTSLMMYVLAATTLPVTPATACANGANVSWTRRPAASCGGIRDLPSP